MIPGSPEEVQASLAILREHKIPVLVLGNGSNLLVGDRGIHGAVLHIGSRMSEIAVEGECIIAQGGALLSAVSAKAAEHSLAGLEFASGIPGSLGGAVTMNAGAYGNEMKDVLESAIVLTKELEIQTISAQVLALSYRHSSLPEKGYILLSARLKLKKGEAESIREKMRTLGEQRREKQPLQYPSAGSTFKRPEGYFAGKLIQDAGLKGKTIGGAQVSEKHAGFIVNTGDATTRDILDLITFCQKAVYNQFGVSLETEVKIVGEL